MSVSLCQPTLGVQLAGDADHLAATKLMARIDDREISRFTPYQEVGKVLDARFLPRMQNRPGALIVPKGPPATGMRGTRVKRARLPLTPGPKRTTASNGGKRERCCRFTESSPMVRDGETPMLWSEKKRSA